MASNFAYRDPAKPVQRRVTDLLSRMTLAEKLGQLCMFEVKRGIPWLRERHVGTIIHQFGEQTVRYQRELGDAHRLQIPILCSLDCIHGHAFYPGATIFPTQIGLSCTWDPDLVREAGAVTAREMTVTGVHWTFSPLLDLARDLRWGRIGETFGEDPYLAGILASAMIRGYQGARLSDPFSVLACAKHFAGYCDSLGGRDSTETVLSQRQLRHDILPPYRMAVDAGCATFMAGYQSLDGTPCSANRWLLTDVLRGEMRFRGFVVSDWDNLQRLIDQHQVCASPEEACAVFIGSGNDMVMTTEWFPEAALRAIRKGLLSVAAVDEACRRVLRIKFELGLFDDKRYPDLDKIPHVVGCDDHKAAALRAARESIVLLENRDRVLPLRDVARLAVVGPNADDIVAHLGDWSIAPGGYPDHYEKHLSLLKLTMGTMLEELRRRADCSIDHVRGCDAIDSEFDQIGEAVAVAQSADAVIAVVGDSTPLAGEGRDRARLELSGKQQPLLEALKATGKPLIVVLMSSKPLCIPWIARNADALLAAWNPGFMGGRAIADVLFGDCNPCGKLTVSFPYDDGQLPARYNQSWGWHSNHGWDRNADYADMPKGRGIRLYPFGFGRSYTTFSYSNFALESARLATGQPLEVSVTVTNTGDRGGSEIVQLYVRDVVASVTRPSKLLRAFARVDLQPGESARVAMNVPFGDLAIVDARGKPVVEPGEFEALAGPSSREEDLLAARFTVIARRPNRRRAAIRRRRANSR